MIDHYVAKTRAAHSGQRGFSVWQFAAACAVGGVLMMVVVRGAGVIDPLRVMVTVQQLHSLDAALRTFQDRYRALPGDGPDLHRLLTRPPARFYTSAGFVDLTGNGRIDGAFLDPLSPTGEQYMAWRDLRTAGLWPGDAGFIGLAAMPENLFGGVMGFAAANLGLDAVVCLTAVPGPAARALDERLDDGAIATGTLRARIRQRDPELQNTYPTPDSTPYTSEATYLVCRQWQR